jgi:hypothetical protein
MAAIDATKFASAVAAQLKARQLSFNQAQRKFEGITKGMLSRVSNGLVVSAPNMLVICKHLDLDPFDYLNMKAANPHSNFGMSHKEKLLISGGSSSCHT